MKGTIDIQIKHKDGSIETRHEHNVVFDLPALMLKHRLEMPDWMHVFCGNSMNPSMGSTPLKDYSLFGLSEDEFSLTQPEYRPFALIGVESNATKWYQSVPSRVVSEKSITLQESWTVQTAMTLKGIAVHNSDPAQIFNYFNDYNFCYIDKTLFCPYLYSSSSSYDNRTYRKANFSMDIFSYNKSYANGFASAGYDTSNCSFGCIPYKLANSAERYAIIINGARSGTERISASQVSLSDSVGIYKYPDDNTLLRSFKFSQFTGFVAAAQNSFFVMTIGDKNYLFEIIRPTNSASALISSFIVWQIPDTAIADSEAIASVKTDFLSEFWPTTADTSYYYPFVIGDYLFLFGKCLKIDTTLGATNHHGYSSTLSAKQLYRYISFDDSGCVYSVNNESSRNGWATYYSSLLWRLYNKTAANFSTPIVLAEGDVLTVSYKIEVA